MSSKEQLRKKKRNQKRRERKKKIWVCIYEKHGSICLDCKRCHVCLPEGFYHGNLKDKVIQREDGFFDFKDWQAINEVDNLSFEELADEDQKISCDRKTDLILSVITSALTRKMAKLNIELPKKLFIYKMHPISVLAYQLVEFNIYEIKTSKLSQKEKDEKLKIQNENHEIIQSFDRIVQHCPFLIKFDVNQPLTTFEGAKTLFKEEDKNITSLDIQRTAALNFCKLNVH